MSNHNRQDIIALDRASVRKLDADGRLHIEMSNISKATVNPYYGQEIPDFEKLKLDPDAVYYMLRDPDELARAAPTFNNLPILSRHMPVNADAPAQELVIGSTGTDAVFEDPYLRNSAVVWVQDEIDDIESESKREWSCGYRYDPDMTPGTYRGLHFDGIMRNIVGNHLALVHEGRAGPDVVVADALTEGLITMPKVRKIAKVKLALDDGIDVDDVTKLISALNGVESAEPVTSDDDDDDDDKDKDTSPDDAPPMTGDDDGDDRLSQVLSFLEGKLSDEDAAALANLVGGGASDDDDSAPDDEDGPDEEAEGGSNASGATPAMDKALAKVRRDTIRQMNAIAEAKEEVFPHIGKVKVAMDSASAIYKLALDAANVSTRGIPPKAFRAMVKMLPKPGARPIVAQDAKATASFYERYPEAAR